MATWLTPIPRWAVHGGIYTRASTAQVHTHTTLPTSATIPRTHALTSSLTICTLCRTHSALLRARRGQRPTDHNGPCCTNLICMQLTTSLIKITTNILPPNRELVIMGQRHMPSQPPSSRRTDACRTDGFLASLELQLDTLMEYRGWDFIAALARTDDATAAPTTRTYASIDRKSVV